MPLIEIRDLKKYFPIRAGLLRKAKSFVHAVDGVNFEIEKGRVFGLAGESGCGKTTVGKCVLRVLKPTDGKICFEGQDIAKLREKELRQLRPKMQIVFQNPYASLNPRKTAYQILRDPFKLYTDMKESEIEKEILKLLEKVGLGAEHMHRYPYEFSGGQRQRIAIARAIAVEPEFIFLDEPTSSLDVSVQAKMLNLLIDLKDELNLSFLFVTHNIDLMKYMADMVAIMYLGKIMELASAEEVFSNPLHPYTQALFSANPTLDPEVKAKRILLHGEVPTPIDPPPGCRFYTRCWLAMEGICDEKEPKLLDVGNGHLIACHRIT
jgi:oligopeptide/dipeptide ABC transporter ATP-binding protein